MTFLTFKEEPRHESRKTQRWTVVSVRDASHPLGWVSWYGAWRKYVFSAGAGAMFDEKCLQEVCEFIEARTREPQSHLGGKEVNECLNCGTGTFALLCHQCLKDRREFPALFADLQKEATQLAELMGERNRVSEEFRTKRPAHQIHDTEWIDAKVRNVILVAEKQMKARAEKRRKLWRAWRSPIIGA